MTAFKFENTTGKTPENKAHHNYLDIARDILESETIKEENFTDVYTKDEIEKDLGFNRKQQEAGKSNSDLGLHESMAQEYCMQQEMVASDWFAEEDLAETLDPEQKGLPMRVMLSSEFDDRKNHVDMIAVINNSLTDYQPVPFAIDATYNIDQDDLNTKMGWRHFQTNIPGVSTVKYFEDTDALPSEGEKTVPKGRIGALPRFVVGFSPELAMQLTETFLSNDDWDSLKKDALSAKAKWCMLTELKTQTEQMLDYYNSHEVDSMVSFLKEQVASLDKFFDMAIKQGKKNDITHPDWISYANVDEVATAITARNIMR